MADSTRKPLPKGFVYADLVVPHCSIDAKYATCDNFIGRPICGYYKPYIIMSDPVAEGCAKAAVKLYKRGYSMLFFDSYRPQCAVDDFVHWCMNLEAQERKNVHYPNVDKAKMLSLGYISNRSGHTRACAVDVTLVDIISGKPLDMGTIFDFMDEHSHHGAKDISQIQNENRYLLCETMRTVGFNPLKEEWWHYSLIDEPYPNRYFNFEIE